MRLVMVRSDLKSGKTIKLSILELITLAHFLCFFGLTGEILEKNVGEMCFYFIFIYHHQNLKSQS